MLSLEHMTYTAAVRWKKGEMEALGLLDEASKDRLLPHLIFPPLTARDLETRRRLSRNEFSLTQVGRLQRFWSSRPCLVDFRFLQFDPRDAARDAAGITDLLEKAREYGCRLIPVFHSDTSAYRASALAAHVQNSACGAAVRITLSDLQNDNLRDMLNIMLASTQSSFSDCVAILDLSDAAIVDIKVFAKAVTGWLEKLHHIGLWKRVIVEASSYPRKNPAKPNGEEETPRNEWIAWLHLAQTDPAILNWASFGDFGADHGHIDFEGGGRTIPHFRYAARDKWIVCRGGGAVEGHDGTIHTVAKRLVSRSEFMGETYSAGDEFVVRCAENGMPGNASTWRRANMIHHMTLTISDIGSLVGIPLQRPQRAPIARQLSMLGLEG